MDIKQLLEKMDQFAGQAVGQKPGDQWRGTDKGTPGKKLVGGDEQQESILKDLKKGPTPKTREQELSEEFQEFLEAEFKDTNDKRPARKSDRHPRGHEPRPRYKTVKTDESVMGDKDIELQDYRSMSHKEFQTAYGMTKTEWINKNKSLVIQNPKLKQALGLDEAGNPAQQAAIAIAMKKAGKKPKNEGTAYKATNPHPASKDPIVAKVVKQMRPGLKDLDMNNEAFLYFAYELGKMRARDSWEDYGPAIKYFYQSGIGVNEDANTDNKLAKLLTRFVNQSEGADRAVALDAIEYIKTLGHIEQFATSLDYFGVDLDEELEESSYYGPVEARWMVKLSDDEGDHLKTYVDKFTSLSAAKKAYKNTLYATDFKYKPVKKDQVEEAIDSDIVQPMGQDSFNRGGFNPIRDQADYLKRRSEAWNLYNASNTDPQTKAEAKQQILDLDKQARAKNYIQSESRGHNIIATKLKDVERAKKFASGELKVPTPQERQAQLKQLEKAKPVKEYGANNVSPYGQPTQTVDPKQSQQVAANLNVQKTALNQLKQINPEIDPQKAATAVTKDVATMNPQEKEELAQVAKTLSPALGTPALGSIKTALQKSQAQAKNN